MYSSNWVKWYQFKMIIHNFYRFYTGCQVGWYSFDIVSRMMKRVITIAKVINLIDVTCSYSGTNSIGSPLSGMIMRYLISLSPGIAPRRPIRSKTIGSANSNWLEPIAKFWLVSTIAKFSNPRNWFLSVK